MEYLKRNHEKEGKTGSSQAERGIASVRYYACKKGGTGLTTTDLAVSSESSTEE